MLPGVGLFPGLPTIQFLNRQNVRGRPGIFGHMYIDRQGVVPNVAFLVISCPRRLKHSKGGVNTAHCLVDLRSKVCELQ